MRPVSAETKGRDGERQEALGELWDRYAEARGYASSTGSGANVEWLLGPKENRFQQAARLDARMLELLGVFLEDLASEIDEPILLMAAAGDSGTHRNSLARRLRAATKAFRIAFRRA